jgi:predicted transcriptional regulator
MTKSSSKSYKDYKIYCCFALNKLVSAYNIDIYQDNLEEKIDEILKKSDAVVTKADIRHEIRSNHTMTNKVLKSLEEDGFIEISKDEQRYSIKITKKGVLHIRKFNEFYLKIYEWQIKDHYKYVGLPSWFRRAENQSQK